MSIRIDNITSGRFGNKKGETESLCSGICSADHACPPASTSPTQIPCTAPTHFAAPGSGGCNPVLSGYYIAIGEDLKDFQWMSKIDVDLGKAVESAPFKFIESSEQNSFINQVIDVNFNNVLDTIWGNPEIWETIRREAIGLTYNYRTEGLVTSYGIIELQKGKQYICPKVKIIFLI